MPCECISLPGLVLLSYVTVKVWASCEARGRVLVGSAKVWIRRLPSQVAGTSAVLRVHVRRYLANGELERLKNATGGQMSALGTQHLCLDSLAAGRCQMLVSVRNAPVIPKQAVELDLTEGGEYILHVR